jgi:hypothetical protein
LKLYFMYFLVFVVSSFQNKSFKIGYLSVIAVWKQFYGYGSFIESYFKIIIFSKSLRKPFRIILKYKMAKTYRINRRYRTVKLQL